MRINPGTILEKDLPLVVLADNLRSWTGKLVKFHTKGEYSHVMEMHRPGFFASQGWMFKEVPVEIYMKKGYRLKFWKPKPLTPEQKEEWLDTTARELRAPWWKRKYDVLGILGQALRMRFVNNPFTKYCSERVAMKIRRFFGVFIGAHPSPSDCNRKLTASPEKAEVLGHYFWDKQVR